MPSYYGVDMRVPENRANPAFVPKLLIEGHIHELVEKGKITYSGITTGDFLEYALNFGALINLVGKPYPVFKGGDVNASLRSHSDIAKAIVSVLQKPDETENRYLLIKSMVTRQNQLLRLAKDVCPGVNSSQ